MITKAPATEWIDQIEYVIVEEETFSDSEEEQDFSEYLWMENEEEFDKSELQRLEEEEMMEECMQAMMEDELLAELDEWEKTRLSEMDEAVVHAVGSHSDVKTSVLNPLAAEFVPRSMIDLNTL